jgi:hypothetical protein
MLAILVSVLLLGALGIFAIYVGVKLVSVLREQFDELMPQRMIDYSGFVDVATTRD